MTTPIESPTREPSVVNDSALVPIPPTSLGDNTSSTPNGELSSSVTNTTTDTQSPSTVNLHSYPSNGAPNSMVAPGIDPTFVALAHAQAQALAAATGTSDPNDPSTATAAAMAHLMMQAQLSQALHSGQSMDSNSFATISAQVQAMTTAAIHQAQQQQQQQVQQQVQQQQHLLRTSQPLEASAIPNIGSNQPNNTTSSTTKVETGSQEWIKQRRESHKEVERRRREVINTGINELAKIVPNCSDRNKGGILHRAVQYIQQLKEAEQRNAERWTLDKMLADQAINDLTGYVEYLKSENESLRNQISELGGQAPPRAQPPAPSVPPYHAHAMAAAMHPNAYPSYHYFAAAAAAAPPPPSVSAATGAWPQATTASPAVTQSAPEN